MPNGELYVQGLCVALQKCVTFPVVRFAWDPRKAQFNRRKHEVSFEEAAECFADSLAMILTDHGHPDRLILIGQSQARRLIFTVYAERDADVIRIISARKATRTERKKYEEGEF